MVLVPKAFNGAAGCIGQSAAAGPQRVMVVDDSSTARVMVQGLLDDSGFETLGFEDGVVALEHLAAFQPDLVVLDILMPGLDGLEVCRRIRATEGGDGIPVLFLTGDERTQTQDQAIAAGGDDLIYKPSLKRELVIRVRSLLRIRRLQTALERESQSLREIQSRQEGLFRFIVHDLKSPLQTILSGAELLAEDDAATPQISTLAGHIRQGSLLMERMVQDILVVCHQGNLDPAHEAIPLRDILEIWTAGLRSSLYRRQVVFLNEVPADLIIHADPELLRRCLLNLLDNALKYGPPGNVIQVEASENKAAWQLRIQDQGPGIPAGMEEVIFDPFARLDRDASLARVSSGLGLAFCREVARAHGGRIWVEPGDPSGSVFCLTLPRSV